MKPSLITLFLALATAIHARVTGNLKVRARLDNEAERAAGMADAVTPKYKKAHGVTPELEAMILADGSGGQGTNSYYESFVPVNLMDGATRKRDKINSHYGLVIPINPQPLGRAVVTVISSIVATRGVIVTASFTVTTTTTSKISICTAQEYTPWIPPPIRPTGTESVRPPTPSRSPITTITVTLTTRTTTHTSPPTKTITIGRISPSNPISTTTTYPTPSFATATLATSGTSDDPVRTSELMPAPTEHPSDAPAEATALDPISKPSPSNESLARPYPTGTTGHRVGTVSVYPIPTSNPTMTIPTVIPPTTLVTRARDLTTTIG